MATESDNVNSGALGTVIAVGTIAFFGIALVVTALVRTEMSEEVEKKDVSADRPYKDLLAEQQAKLHGSPAFINRKKGTVSLPIERAMELTVDGLKKDPNSATPPGPATGGAGGAGGGAMAAAGGGGAGGASGGSAGAGGATPGTSNPPPAVAPTGTVGAESPPGAPKDNEKTEAEKKKAPKKAPTPPLPAPAAPPPAPAAPAAPNGQ